MSVSLAGLGGLAGLSLEHLAKQFGTPLYVYDVDAIVEEARAIQRAFGDAPHLVAYAVKANTAGPILRALAAAGCGADVVSGGELEAALGAGVSPERILYSGVAKGDDEIRLAIGAGERGILALHVESVEEIDRVAAIAQAVGRRARVGLRINPEIETVGTHDHIATGHDEAKFGVALDDVPLAIERILARAELDLGGLTVHVGSQLVATDAYRASAKRLFQIARALPDRGALRFLDTGGGFGIDYGEGCLVTPADFVRAALEEQASAGLGGIPLFVEPGRRLVASHGVLVARVIQRKAAKPVPWVFIDAGMNDLIRPALYQARHRIVPCGVFSGSSREVRVAGPVCESADDFGIHALPDDASQGASVAILDAGAYGFTMASQYNARSLPAEVFVTGGRVSSVIPRSDSKMWLRTRLA
jgi:diaminopimelate decarboxylase